MKVFEALFPPLTKTYRFLDSINVIHLRDINQAITDRTATIAESILSPIARRVAYGG